MVHNNSMSIDTSIIAELNDVVERLRRGVRDRDAMRLACEEMDREREFLRQNVGLLNVAVDLVHETRDE